ncbi:MAG: hypothetical protein JJT88_19140 [Gammaproteobacteria bacterium]|nr:hypothetical protein [Gammaproteobacteria bacterium]
MVISSTCPTRIPRRTSVLRRASILALAMLLPPAIAAMTIADGMNGAAYRMTPAVAPGIEAKATAAPLVSPQTLTKSTPWSGSSDMPLNGADVGVDLLSVSQPSSASRTAPLMLVSASEFPMHAATVITGIPPGIPADPVGPRMLLSGLGIALLFGLTVLAGINSRKRWPNMLAVSTP